MNTLATSFHLLLMALVLLAVLVDRLRRRRAPASVGVSVLIPCYNDGATVEATVRSVFETFRILAQRDGVVRVDLEVLAINDASRDDSEAVLDRLKEVFPLRVIHHRENRGKSACLNLAAGSCQQPILLCLDADTELNVEALWDVLRRLHHQDRVAAVSCPYQPANWGFLASMQAIEYNLLRIVQGAGNIFSSLVLWGGCLAVRREVFLQLGGFQEGAITEDVDLAFRLNQQGWRVEQSFTRVRSHVPSGFRAWFKQKLRWTAGGFQCAFRYPKVWARQPLQPLFSLSYLLMVISGMVGVASDTSWFDIAEHAYELWEDDLSAATIWRLIDLSYGHVLLAKIASTFAFCLLSLLYVLPLVTKLEEVLRLALIVPFVVGYYPIHTLVSVAGFAFWFFVLRRLPMDRRVW